MISYECLCHDIHHGCLSALLQLVVLTGQALCCSKAATEQTFGKTVRMAGTGSSYGASGMCTS